MILKNSKDLRDCRNVFDLADILNTKVKTLLYFAYNNNSLYKHYTIKKKSGGYRNISAPDEALKTTCKKINNYLNDIYSEYLPWSTHGFVRSRNIITNAKNHVFKKYVLNLDLENFFENINTGRVLGFFNSYPLCFDKKLSSVITGIVTYNNSLPQGSPCSPVISNMICWKMDRELIEVARKNGWTYSRYADDITISSNSLNNKLAKISKDGVIVSENIEKIIIKNGFSLNEKKTRISYPNQSKWVTGIKVNKKCNVSRIYIKQVRSMLNAWEKYNYEEANKYYNAYYNIGRKKHLRDVLRGKIDYIGNVKSKDNIIYIKLYNRFCVLDGKNHLIIPETKKEEYLNKILIIKSENGYGSGFFVNKNFIVTCAHVVGKDKNIMFTTRDKKFPVEFRSASVVEVNEKKDFAILHTYSDFSKLVFSIKQKEFRCDFESEYISVGYGGFRSDDGFWSEPCIVDQKIVQEKDNNGEKEFLVNNAMWSGMSGGPIISKSSNLIEGYITNGASSLENSLNVKNFTFRSISNIPLSYLKENTEIKNEEKSSSDLIIYI